MRIHSVGDKISCSSRLGEESAILPALITVEKINTLRFPSIRAKAKEVEIWTSQDINADKDRCGLKGSPTRVLATYESNSGKRKCAFIRPDELMAVVNASRNKISEKIDIKHSSARIFEYADYGIAGDIRETLEATGIITRQKCPPPIQVVITQSF